MEFPVLGYMPPSTRSTWPVMYPASGPAKKATAPAISWGWAARPMGTSLRA